MLGKKGRNKANLCEGRGLARRFCEEAGPGRVSANGEWQNTGQLKCKSFSLCSESDCNLATGSVEGGFRSAFWRASSASRADFLLSTSKICFATQSFPQVTCTAGGVNTHHGAKIHIAPGWTLIPRITHHRQEYTSRIPKHQGDA